MAPPCGFTCSASSGRPQERVQASAWAAKASLRSMTSKSRARISSRSHSLATAGIGPTPITRGATAPAAPPAIRARGSRPNRFTASSDASSSAAAPSLTPDALPAVIVPSGRTMGFRALRASSVVSARGCSSRLTTISPLRSGMVTGAISPSNQPLAWTAPARCWLRRAKASWSARLIWKSVATFSAVSGMESTP